VAASLDVGSRIFLSDRFSVGLCMTNLNSASMTQSDDMLPQSLAGGIAYLSDALNLGIEYFKELGFPSAVRVAAEYSRRIHYGPHRYGERIRFIQRRPLAQAGAFHGRVRCYVPPGAGRYPFLRCFRQICPHGGI